MTPEPIRLWVCQVRKEAFVGGESQRCRHTETCGNCNGTGESVGRGVLLFACPVCNGTGQVSECGEMELIGGEPVEWCVVHESIRYGSLDECWLALWDVAPVNESDNVDPCEFESQIRVGP